MFSDINFECLYWLFISDLSLQEIWDRKMCRGLRSPLALSLISHTWVQVSLKCCSSWRLGHTSSSSPGPMVRQQWNRMLPRYWTASRFISVWFRAKLTYLPGRVGKWVQHWFQQLKEQSPIPHPVGVRLSGSVQVLKLLLSSADLETNSKRGIAHKYTVCVHTRVKLLAATC